METWQTCSDGTHVRREQAVAGDDGLLGHGRPSGQAEAARDLALVELRALGEPGVLRVLGDHPVEGLDVLQRPAHQQRVGHAPAIVGEHPDARGRVGHGAELGEPGAGQPGGDRAHRLDVAVPCRAAEPPDLLHHSGGIGDGFGIGHGVHGGEAAQGRGAGAGLDRLSVLTARLAQVSVQVHQTRQGHQAARVEHAGAGLAQPGPDGRDGRRPASSRSVTARPPGPVTSAPCISHEVLAGLMRLPPGTPCRRAAGTGRPSGW